MSRWLFLVSTTLVLGAAPAFAKSKPDLPANVRQLIDDLFSAPGYLQAQLAPDGAHLAFLREEDGVKILKSYEFKTQRTYQLAGASGVNHTMGSALQQNIVGFDWLGPNQIAIVANEGNIYYSGLWVATANLKKCDQVKLHDRVLYVSDPLPQNPRVALLQQPGKEGWFGPLWALDKASLSTYELEQNPGRVVAWKADAASAVRLAMVAGQNSQWSYLYRDAKGSPWRPLSLPTGSEVITFDPSGQNLLFAKAGSGPRAELHSFDLQKDAPDAGAMSDPVYDILPSLIRDPRTGATIGLVYDAEKPKTIWLHPQFQQLTETLEGIFPGLVVYPMGAIDDHQVLFSTFSDVSPAAIYRYDLKQQKIDRLLTKHTRAADKAWSPMQAIHFAARDGCAIHGYLTLPREHPSGKPVPLVALSHGGPDARDTWGFEPEVQFLAAMGYAVLQVNYRGSSGYGIDYGLNTAIEVAQTSVNDVADGIKWAVEQRMADPKKVVVVGASYGGYISLAIATRYPQLAAAAVGMAGVYDWEDFYLSRKGGWFSEHDLNGYMRWRADYYLDPKTHAAEYRAVSPVHVADQVQCPILLYHGTIDQTVEFSQSKSMAKALEAAHKTVELVKESETSHGFPGAEQAKEFYTTLAAFLLRTVPPK